MKNYFLSFSAGSEDFIDSLNYLINQAKSMDCFAEVYGFTDIDLFSAEHSLFINKFGDFIKDNKRGYGFWIWKSYLINYLIKKIPDDSILVYADSGCRLSNKSFMMSLLEASSSNQFIAAYTSHNHEQYTSSIALNTLDSDQVYRDQKMIEATTFVIRANHQTRHMVNKWMNYCQRTELIIDPIRDQESEVFIDHRHDQSLLSLCIYNHYHELIPSIKYQRLLHSAIVPVRLKSYFDINMYSKFNIGNLSYSIIKPDKFKCLYLSSYYGESQTYIDESLLKLISLEFKGDYSFHTDFELNPWLVVEFFEVISCKIIILENRRGLEDRISNLDVFVSQDNITYISVCSINNNFGGFYNGQHLIISLPNISIKSIRVVSNNLMKYPLHLKSLYFYE